jgi:hypothetical protein
MAQTTTISSSALDFTSIKNNLKTYLEQQKEFADYDFEASGLSNLLDVLAYNTHINGLTANFALNESFLNTAQLRSSVVSHAETLGYIPGSKTASQARINMSFNLGENTPNVPEKLQISSGYKFTAAVDDASYTFQTQELIEALNDGNNFFEFKTLNGDRNIPIYEGIARTKTFFAGGTGENMLYIIPDENMDKSTAVIKVFESATSADFTTYTNLETATQITATTPAYILKEAPNGFFELTFGNGSTLGAVPKAGSKITVEYLAVDGANANGARIFEPINTVEVTEPPSGVGLERLPIVSTNSKSVGGADKEKLDSIRKNAPFRYATQNRMVTHVDYANLILRTYGALIKDIIAWGGEDNLEPEYGTAFLSIEFKPDLTQTIINQTKDNIRVLVDQMSIASFGLKFTDPIKTFIEANVFFQYNPDYTNLSINALQEKVRNTMTNYFVTNTGKFGQSFRRSQILADVDEVSNAILSSRADIKMQQRFLPSAGIEQDFKFSFPVPIATPDDKNQIIESSTFKFRGKNCKIRNELVQPTATASVSSNRIEYDIYGRPIVIQDIITTTTATGLVTATSTASVNGTVSVSAVSGLTAGTKLQVVDIATGEKIKDNVGSYIASTGRVNLVGFQADESKVIKLSCVPANASAIVPEREYILQYDNTRLSAKGLRTTSSN